MTRLLDAAMFLIIATCSAFLVLLVTG